MLGVPFTELSKLDVHPSALSKLVVYTNELAKLGVHPNALHVQAWVVHQ